MQSSIWSAGLSALTRTICILTIVWLLVGLTGMIGGCTKASPLKVTLNDLYYEEFYAGGTTFDMLVAELTIDNEGRSEVYVSENYVLDAEGTVYEAFLLYEKWTETNCLCSKTDIVYKKIDCVQPGEKTAGYSMLRKDVPKDVTGLKLVIEIEAGQVTLPLPDTSSIRIINLPGFH